MSSFCASAPWGRLCDLEPGQALGLLAASPLISAVLGVALAFVILLARTRSARSLRPGASPAPRPADGALRLAAVAAAVAWLADLVVRGHLVDMSALVSWWRFVVVLVVAAAAVAVVALTWRSPATRRVGSAAALTRRTWSTFAPPRGLRATAGLAVVLVAVTLACGMASTSLGGGPAMYLRQNVPNTDVAPLFLPFPGWAYGVPSLAALVLLVAAIVFALHRDAARPYAAHMDIAVDNAGRRARAASLLLIASGAMLLVLGGVARMAASAAGGSLISSDATGAREYSVGVPYAEVLQAAGVVAPLLEIAGVVLFVLVIGGGSAPAVRSEPRATAVGVRP